MLGARMPGDRTVPLVLHDWGGKTELHFSNAPSQRPKPQMGMKDVQSLFQCQKEVENQTQFTTLQVHIASKIHRGDAKRRASDSVARKRCSPFGIPFPTSIFPLFGEVIEGAYGYDGKCTG